MWYRHALLAISLLAPVIAPAQEFSIGSQVKELSVVDTKGLSHAVPLAGAKPTVVIFTSTQCPISNAYNERMNQLYKQFNGTGVQFLFLNANQNEAAVDITRHLDANRLTYPVYRDVDNKIADRFGASVTPEAYVFDKGGVLRYHGAIDDSQNEARIKATPLKSAILAVMAGQQPEKTEAKAFGCTIKRARKTS